MSKDIDDINRVLEVLGSDMRVEAGDLVATAFAEVIRLIPIYVENKVAEVFDGKWGR